MYLLSYSCLPKLEKLEAVKIKPKQCHMASCQWLMSIILATLEAELKRIVV
jgi:hypothetical protein